MPTRTTLINHLRDHKLAQYKIAYKLGMSPPRLSGLARGKLNPTDQEKAALGKFLGVSPIQLFPDNINPSDLSHRERVLLAMKTLGRACTVADLHKQVVGLTKDQIRLTLRYLKDKGEVVAARNHRFVLNEDAETTAHTSDPKWQKEDTLTTYAERLLHEHGSFEDLHISKFKEFWPYFTKPQIRDTVKRLKNAGVLTRTGHAIYSFKATATAHASTVDPPTQQNGPKPITILKKKGVFSNREDVVVENTQQPVKLFEQRYQDAKDAFFTASGGLAREFDDILQCMSRELRRAHSTITVLNSRIAYLEERLVESTKARIYHELQQPETIDAASRIVPAIADLHFQAEGPGRFRKAWHFVVEQFHEEQKLRKLYPLVDLIKARDQFRESGDESATLVSTAKRMKPRWQIAFLETVYKLYRQSLDAARDRGDIA